MPHRTPLLITSGRHPFEVALLVASVFLGITLTLSGRTPSSAAKVMPNAVLTLWIVLLTGAGIIALAGVFWRGNLTSGLRVELAGILLMAGGCSMYVVALFTVSGMAALVAGGYMVAVSGGAWWRAGQIVHDVRRLGRASTMTVPVLAQESS